MKKGIVMEMDDGFLTLLTPEGEFLKARRQEKPYNLGEEIYFFPINQTNTSKISIIMNRLLKAKVSWIAVAVVLLISGTLIPMSQNDKAYAYMSIDVNPSVELGVNKKMQVVELTGYNKDGKRVISQLSNWKGKEISDVTESILAAIKKDGYLTEHKQIIISTVRTDKHNKAVEQKLTNNIEEIKSSIQSKDVKVTVLKGTIKDLKAAHKLGVTTGKYQTENSQKKTTIKKMNQNEQKDQKLKKTPPISPQNTFSPGLVKKQAEPTNGKTTSQISGFDFKKEKTIPQGQVKKQAEPAKGNQNKKVEAKPSNNKPDFKKEKPSSSGQLKKETAVQKYRKLEQERKSPSQSQHSMARNKAPNVNNHQKVNFHNFKHK